MAYTKIEKPKSNSFLNKEDGFYLLLENGGKIILRGAWSKIAKATASYTKIAKPAIP